MIKPWVFGFLPERKPSSGFLTSEPLLALASLDLACRDHCPGVSATFTTTAFDHSGSRWLGINDLITESEGPSGCKQPFDRRSTIEQAMAVTASCHHINPTGGPLCLGKDWFVPQIKCAAELPRWLQRYNLAPVSWRGQINTTDRLLGIHDY